MEDLKTDDALARDGSQITQKSKYTYCNGFRGSYI